MRKMIIACAAALCSAVAVWAGSSSASVSIPQAGGSSSASLSFSTAGAYVFDGSSRPDWITGITVAIKTGSSSITVGAGRNTITLAAGATATATFTGSANTTGSARSWTYPITSSSTTVNVTVSQAAGSSLTSYTVTYKPGASGTGSQQTATKYQGVSLLLKGAIFTRAGYTQTGWATYEGGSKAYELGGTYTGNAALTLYPVWAATTSGLPNFVFYQVSGWPSSMFLTSSSSGTTSATTFKQGDPLYLRYAYINGGTVASASALTVKLYFDGTLFDTKTDDAGLEVSGGHSRWNELISKNMSVGTHTIKIVLNPSQAITESSYTDNEKSITFTVTAEEDEQETETKNVTVASAGGSASASLTFDKAGMYQFAGGSKPSWITGITVAIKTGSSSINVGSGNNNVEIAAGGTATVNFTVAANTTTSSRSWTYVVSGASRTYNVVVTQPGNTPVTTYTVTLKPGTYSSGSQRTLTKNKGVDLVLSGAVFTRSGYTQTGWSKNASGSTKDYAVGGKYTTDADITLYPYWESSSNPAPVWNPVTKPDTVIVYARVYDKSSGTYLETADGLLGAFSSSGECRGKATLTDGPVSKLFQLTVGIESSSETGLALKYWNAAKGIVEIGETFNASSATIGTIAAPKTFYVGETVSEFTLAQGWTWVSVNVEPVDASFSSVFKGVSFANNDVIKSSDGSATYYSGTWYPSPTTFKLVPGRAYAVKKSTAGSATVKVSGAAAAATQAVSAGWNWIGATTSDSAALSKLTHSAGFSNNDVINASGSSATYYGGTWYGSLTSLVPGVGYKAKFAKAGTINFGK